MALSRLTGHARNGIAGALSLAMVGGLAPATVAAAVPTDAERVAGGIASLGVTLDGLALDPVVGTRLPMTLQSPASLLGFPTLFASTLGTVDDAAPANETELLSALTSIPLADGAATDVTVDGGTGVWTVTIGVDHAVDDATIPLLYVDPGDESNPEEDPGTVISAGEITGVDATLTGTLTLRYDPSITLAGDPTTVDGAQALSLDPTSNLSFSIDGRDETILASSTFGLTQVDVSGTGDIGLGGGVAFTDPDASGAITREEWETTLLADLAAVTAADQSGDDFNVALDLDSDLVAGEGDGVLTFGGDAGTWIATDGSLEPTGAPTLTPEPDLAPFGNVTVEDALAALAQYATTIQALEGAIDIPLPFVDASLRDFTSPATAVMGVLERQASAAVVCGKVPTMPPTGAELSGTTWYCQGYATEDPSAVTWSLDGSDYSFAADGSDTDTDTVGVSPTELVTIEANTGVDGSTPPDVTVEFTISDDEGNDLDLTAARRFRSAEELAVALDAELDSVSLAYDAATDSLAWDLTHADDPDAADVAFDIGDLLRTPTHLAGVEGTGTPVSVDVGNVTLDSGFGLLMQDDLPDPEATRGARYFFVENPGGAELAAASVDGSLTADHGLTGQIGYLAVTATATASVFDIATTSGDALSSEVAATTGLDHDAVGATDAITDAILFSELLSDPSATITPAVNLSAALELDVAPAGGLDIGLDSSDDTTIDVTWPDYFGGGADITLGTQYEDLLYPFDIAPTVDGVFIGADEETVVQAASSTPQLDFTTALGNLYGDLELFPHLDTNDTNDGSYFPGVLTNLTSGASCVGIEVIAADQIACAEATGSDSGLQGAARTIPAVDPNPDDTELPAADNAWRAGDRWMIEGDPEALRSVVLDGLFDLTDRMSRFDGSDFGDGLPLIGSSPAELSTHVPAVAEAINAVRSLPVDPEPVDADPSDDPRAPETLQALVTALETALGDVADIDSAAVALAVDETITNPGSSDDATDRTGTHLKVLVDVSTSELTTEAPIRIDLGTDSALGAAAGMDLIRDRSDVAATLPVTYEGEADIDIAIPLDPTIPFRHVLALDSSAVWLRDVAAGSEEVSISASLGPLKVIAGTGADLTGTHEVPDGSHTAATAVASGNHDPVEGSAGTDTTATVVKGTTTGAVSDGDTVTKDGTSPAQTCTVSAKTATEFTCALDNSGSWASGDTWTATSMATFVPDSDPVEVLAGMLLVANGGSCELTGDEVANCGIAGPWTSASTWEVRQGFTLEDTTRSGESGFDQLLMITPPETPTVTVQRLDGGTVMSSCDSTLPAGATTATTLTCEVPLTTSGGDTDAWLNGDDYELRFGDPTTTLYDPGKHFQDLGIEGATLSNETDGVSCVVDSTTADTVTCEEALPDGHTWDDGDEYLVEGIGVAKFAMDSYALTGSSDAVIAEFVAGMDSAALGETDPQECDPDDWAGDACAILSLVVPADPEVTDSEDRYLGALSWEADLASGVSGGDVPSLSKRIDDALAGEEPVQFTLLSTAFQVLRDAVADALDGTLINEPLPLIGVDVSAGARLLEAIDEAEIKVASLAPPSLTTPETLSGLQTDVHAWMVAALTEVTDLEGGALLKLLDPTGDADLSDAVEVTLLCGGEDVCDPTTNVLAEVTDLNVSFVLGNYLAAGELSPGTDCEHCVGDAIELSFDAGLDGFPLETDATVESKVGWALPVQFGVSREVGPYLDVTEDQFELDALVQFPDDTGDCPTLPDGGAGFSSDRCAVATIGLFQGVIWDGEDPAGDHQTAPHPDDTESDRTKLTLETTLDIGADTTEDRISAVSIFSGEVPTLAFRLNADGNVDLYFQTGIDLSGLSEGLPEVDGLPSVQGAVHITYDMSTGVMLGIESEDTAYSTDITFDRLILDAGSFFKNFVSPIAAEIQYYTKPLKPVIDLLYTPIPVISDVSKMTGNGEVRPFDLLKAATGSDLTMVERVLEIILFADQVVTWAAQGYVPLGEDDGVENEFDVSPQFTQLNVPADAGKFAVNPKLKRTGDCGGKNPDGSLKSKNCKGSYNKRGTKITSNVKQLSNCGSDGQKACTGKELTRTTTTRLQSPRLVPGGLTFPFMDDATQIFGMLIGEGDAVLVRFDAGTLVASAGLSVSFGPFMAGPVPIDITVGATFSVQGRLVLGYDTRGITNLLKQDPTEFDPSALLDGIFIDDLDVSGLDVPEITFAVTATLAASVSVKIFKVGLEGGVTLALLFNLNDPDADGRLRIDEIMSLAAADPICLFDISATLEFFLAFFVEIDIKIKTIRWSKTLFRAGPFQLFEISCEPDPPALATVADDTRDAGDGADLRLNIGETYVSFRNYAENKDKERYLVRQLTAIGDGPDGGTKVSIEGFGLYQEFTVPAGGHIWGLAGNENDTLRFEPGTTGIDGDDPDDKPDLIAFTLPVHVDGGPGNDKITTGDGPDEVFGGTGNDKVVTGGGNDVVYAQAGNDNVSGGPGNDALDGGADDDIVGGDQGGDVVAGGPGNDDLGGGPGLSQDVYDALPAARKVGLVEAALTDVGDVLWGGGDDDRLRGHHGGDVLFGDELLGFGTTPSDVEALAAVFSGGTLTGFTAANACAADGTVTGNDTLDGEAGGDRLFGGNGVDEVIGNGGDDHACGNGGRDLVDGDSATGSTGDDEVDGGDGNDRVFGRAGNDTVRGGDGNDLVDGDVGNDVLFGGDGQDTVVAGDGHDVAMGDTGTVTVTVGGSFSGGPEAMAGSGISPDGEAGGAGDQPVAPAICVDRVAVRNGRLDINGDGAADISDDGRFAGFAVVDGKVDVDEDSDVNADPEDVDVIGEVGVVGGVLQTADTILQGAASGAGSTDADCVIGGRGNDLLFGNAGQDVVHAGSGTDYLDGNAGSDWLRGEQGDDVAHGGTGPDTVYGDSGDDRLFGGAPDLSVGTDGKDTIDGGSGVDEIYGNADADTLKGGGGTDAIVGGSAEAGQADSGDTIDGGAGADVIAGDNAKAIRTSSGDAFQGVHLLDVPVVGGTYADVGGGDSIQGGPQDDSIHGQQGSDEIWGGRHVDHISGGSGVDTLYGDEGGDRLIGGSSTHHSDDDPSSLVDLPGVADDGDTIHGGAGDDLIAGDNAKVDGGAIILFDVEHEGETVVAEVAGTDDLYGEDGSDTIRGQSENDRIWGGEEGDDLEGNAGSDQIWGEQDPDVIIGGSRTSLVLDAGDYLYGGGDADLILGDNADVTGTDADVTERPTVLHDVPAVGEDGGDTAGGDQIWGDDESGDTGTPGADRIYGQAKGDTIHGQDGDDDLQGNAGSDHVYGEDGTDRVVGGSASDQSGTGGTTQQFVGVADADDDLFGGGGTDHIAGDNAVIDPDGTFHLADVRDLDLTPLPDAGVAGGDRIYGDVALDGNDLSGDPGAEDFVRGQSGGDTIHGQAATDDIEGNSGADTIFGEDGDDLVVGGSRQANVDDAEVSDAGDTIAGGAGTDWIAGDNALLVDTGSGNRTIELLDVPVAGESSQPDPDSAGGDRIFGDIGDAVEMPGDLSTGSGAADVVYGQSGEDVIDAQQGDDVVDGNAGSDTIRGQDGDDALVGGSSADDGTASLVAGGDPVIPADGPGAGRRLLIGVDDAAGDDISGGAGVDVILGDNGVVAGHGLTATWRLHDVDVAGVASDDAHVDAAGGDSLSGDQGTDVVLGQAGDDGLSGGDSDDSLHGGPGSDTLAGDAGADDLVGGSSHHWVGSELVELRTLHDGDDQLFGDAPGASCLSDFEDCATDANPSAGGDLGDTAIGDNGHITRGDLGDARLVDPATDVNTDDPIRRILLYDVDIADGDTWAPAASGSDHLFGAAGRDGLFGQGKGDFLYGQDGDDEVEGNGGDDELYGADGSDDLIGGSSSDDEGLVRAGPFPDQGTDVADGDDRIFGALDDDVALGDNGVVLRPVEDEWESHLDPYGHVKRSKIEVAFEFEADGAFGDDLIDGGDGHDDLRGQLGNDELHGREGDDTILGDLGHILGHEVIKTETAFEAIPADALNEPVYLEDSLYREVELFETTGGDKQISTSVGTGDDLITGGLGNDVVFGGSGDDTIHGHGDIADDGEPDKGADFDAVIELNTACADGANWLSCDQDDIFAGHGDDNAWGGPGHDRLFGGHNADDLDVIRQAPEDDDLFGNPDVDFVGVDLIFGGWGQDTMQANQSVNGPDPGDRLIDSAGAYNAYFVCDGGYGDFTAMRRLDPAKITFLENVATAAGATVAGTPGSSGWWELANIYHQDVKHNTNPVHPENPGNFVCNSPT